MAVAARTFLVFQNGKAFLKSETAEILFKSISVTANGVDNGLVITENGGAFDFNGKALSNVGNVDGVDVSIFKTAYDAHVDGGASKHDATEVDYERSDGSKKDIQAASDDVESALTDLDDAKISKTGSIAFTAAQSMGGFKLTNVAVPTLDTDAATKGYVDAVQQGLDVKQSVRALSLSNITLSGAQTIDGVSLVAGDRVLVAGQTTASANGIYVVAAGAWSRSTDADTSLKVTAGMFTFVAEGTTYADTGWVVNTNDSIVLGTTAISFTQFSGAGAIAVRDGLTKTGNILDLRVDESTLEIAGGVGSGGAGRIKDLGVTLAKLAAGSVDENKILASTYGAELVGGSGAKVNVETFQTAANNSGSSIAAGKVVALKDVAGAMEMELADADTTDLEDKIIGVLIATTATGASGNVHVRQGTKVTPFGGGSFVIGKTVYVSVTGGSATQTAPSGSLQHVYRLGRAVSATVVRLDQEHEGEYV